MNKASRSGIAAMLRWGRRVRDRSSRYALLTAALATILGLLAALELAEGRSTSVGMVLEALLVAAGVVIVLTVLVRGPLPSGVGIVLVVVAAVVTVHSVGYSTERPNAISGVQQIPILATYLAWVYPANVARGCVAGIVGAVSGAAVLGPFGQTGATFTASTVVAMALFAWLCVEIGIQLRSETRSEAQTDVLTGVLNRRGFHDRARVEFRRAARRDEPVTIAVLDLDDFKSVNDAGGHAAGDDVLRMLVQQWTMQIRAEDTIARIGGDEFALMLPSTTAEEARTTLTALRSGAVHPWSWGVAERRDDDGVADVIRRADRAMYRGKPRR